MEISDDRVQKAIDYLANTDVLAAKARALCEGLSEQRKSVKALLFSNAPDGPIQAKENWSYAHQEYAAHLDKLQTAIVEWETLRNRRLTATLIVDVWRSCNANRRSGNL